MVDASNLASSGLVDDRESTNTNPGILTLDQYIELFGDSDDTDLSFHGFDEELHVMKGPEVTPISEKTSARRVFKRQLSPTDDSNPYKKKYLSYTKDRGKQGLPEETRQHGCYSKSVCDKENKLTLPNDFQQRVNPMNKTVKNLVDRAYKIKHRRATIHTRSNYTRLTTPRPRRKQKTNYDSDFVYDPPVKRQKNKEEICSDEIENIGGGRKPKGDDTNNPACIYKHSNIKENVAKQGRVTKGSRLSVGGCTPEVAMVSSFQGKNKGLRARLTHNIGHQRCTGNAQRDVTKLGTKKKARIKCATESDILPGSKKRVKMKNHTLIHQQDSPYEMATYSDLPLLPDIKNESPSDCDFNDTSCDQKDFSDMYYCDERENLQTPGTSGCDNKDSFTDLVLQDKDGNYTSLKFDRSVVKVEDDAEWGSKKSSHRDDQPTAVLPDYLSQSNVDEKHTVTIDESNRRKLCQSKEEIQNNQKRKGKLPREYLHNSRLSSYQSNYNNITKYERICKESLNDADTVQNCVSENLKVKADDPPKITRLKKNSGNPLQLKVIKRNNKVQIVNFKNHLITFCGNCSNCKRDVDCGECKLCKNTKKHSKGLLPCWKRRCLDPIIGEVVSLSNHRISKGDEADTNVNAPKEISTNNLVKEKENSLEKVEVCLISDNSIQSLARQGENGEVKFHVQHSEKKARKKDLNTSDIDVFTGISTIKPKLRSTMNELTTRTDPMDITLPRIGFGPETLAKLPWPHDTTEDSAWVSGHHICLTTPMDLDLLNLCFLCGSAGKEKMVVCNFCCEMFHPYCLDVDPIDNKNWRCDRCKRCVVCGFKGNLLMCDRCHDCYHADCLGPFYQRDTEGDEETWYCGKCVQCSKCGQRRAGKEKTSKWMYNFSMCEDCGINWKKGNYCPVCEKIFGDHDNHLKMMCCCKCERWLHMECEGISVDDYEILTDLPEIIPYICKICSGKEKESMPWYIEVQEELNGGFLKVYYDVTSHKDLKLVKEQLGQIQGIASCLEVFDAVFKSIEGCKFSCVNDFHVFMLEALQKLSFGLKKLAVSDISVSYYPNIDRLKNYFEKVLKTLFPWFLPNVDTSVERSLADSRYIESSTPRYTETVLHDHKYARSPSNNSNEQKITSSSEEDEWAFNIILDKPKSRKHVDIRRCIFCNQFGDGEEFNTGRLLYAGVNEWVHINCALWSAEVYEDEQGRLKHVYDALKRGNKLKCDCCDQLGATIGCCSLKCPKSYHFYCAYKSRVVFLDDKKIYCEVHASKANKSLILTPAQLSVPRRVIVDLSRFKSLKRVQRGLDPKSINVFSGGFSLLSLGSLSEQADVKRALIPIGYTITRIFWSCKRPTRRCKYTCEVKMLRDYAVEEKEMENASNDAVDETLTYCHDGNEWQKIIDRIVCKCKLNTMHKPKRGTKRKINFPFPCEKCLANQRYVYQRHSDFLASTFNLMLRKNRLATEVDHNFFPIKREKVDESDANEDKGCSTEIHINNSTSNVSRIHEIKTSLKTDYNANITYESVPGLSSGDVVGEGNVLLKDTVICATEKEKSNGQNSSNLYVASVSEARTFTPIHIVNTATTSVVNQSCVVSNAVTSSNLIDKKVQFLANFSHGKSVSDISDHSFKVGSEQHSTLVTDTKCIECPTLTDSNGNFNIIIPSTSKSNTNATVSRCSAALSEMSDCCTVSSIYGKPADSILPDIKTNCIKCPTLTGSNGNFNIIIPSTSNTNATFSRYSAALSEMSDGYTVNTIYGKPNDSVLPDVKLENSHMNLFVNNHSDKNISRVNITRKYFHTDINKMRTNLYNKLSQGYRSDGKLFCNNKLVLDPVQQFKDIQPVTAASCFLNSPGRIVAKANTGHVLNYSVCSGNASLIYNAHGFPLPAKSTTSPSLLKTYPCRNSTSNLAQKVTYTDTSFMPSFSLSSISNLGNTPNNLLNDVNTSKQVNSYLHKLDGHINTKVSTGHTLSHGNDMAVKYSSGMYSIFGRSPKGAVSDTNMNKNNATLDPEKKKTATSSLETSSNNMKLNITPSLDLKRDLLFRQLKEYLTKNPNVVNLVDNVASKEKDSNVPIVNLTEPESKRDSVCYSVYLPEHLWNDLVNAGIAKNDIQKILRENSERNTPASTSSAHVSSEGSRILSQTRNELLGQHNSNLPSDYSKYPTSVKIDNPLQSKAECISSNFIVAHAIQLPSSISTIPIAPKNSNFYITSTAARAAHSLTFHTLGNNILKSKYNVRQPLSTPPLQPPACIINTTLNNDTTCASIGSHNYAKSIHNISQHSSSSSKNNSMYNNHSTYLTTNHYNNSYANTNVFSYNHIPADHHTSACKGGSTNHYTFPSIVGKPDNNFTGLCYQPVYNNILHKTSVMVNAGKDNEPFYNVSEAIPASTMSSVLKPKRKYKKRVKNGTEGDKIADITDCNCGLDDETITANRGLKSGPVMRKKKDKSAANIISANTEIDFCTFDVNTYGDKFVDTSLPLENMDISEEKHLKRKSNLPKKQRRNYVQSLKKYLLEQELSEKKKTETELKFVVKNEDGWEYESSSLLELWKALIGVLNENRMEINLTPFPIDLNDAYEFLGVTKEFVAYLVEQLPGGHKCRNYKFQHHLPCLREDDNDLAINPSGFARGEIAIRNAENDMFAWLASPYRLPPKLGDENIEEEVLGGMQDLPVAMKYRFLKNTSKDHVGVFRSKIQGRGLYCKKTIEESDMIIEYSGELIRASLTDRREEYYEKQGIGCYMFRIDEMEVVDATMKGNAARFINHSCEPNCFSKIITVDGSKKIVIYALRRINVGEELTYDYKFTHEDDKLPCYCGSKKCRKYMN